MQGEAAVRCQVRQSRQSIRRQETCAVHGHAWLHHAPSTKTAVWLSQHGKRAVVNIVNMIASCHGSTATLPTAHHPHAQRLPLKYLSPLAPPLIFLSLGASRGSRVARKAQKSTEIFTKDAPARKFRCGEVFKASEQVGVLKRFGYFDPLQLATSEIWKPLRDVVPRVGFSEDKGRVGLGFGIGSDFEPSRLNISEDERWFRRLREAELKHGRVAMLAASGFFAAHVVRVPGFEDAAEGIAGGLANEAWQRISILIFILCGQLERNQFRQESRREIGDFGDPLKLGQYTAQMRLGELVNGRLAMLSCAIIASTEFYSGMPAAQAWFPL